MHYVSQFENRVVHTWGYCKHVMMQKVDILAYFWCCQFHPMSCWHRVQGRLELHSNPRLIFSLFVLSLSLIWCTYICCLSFQTKLSWNIVLLPSSPVLCLLDLQAISYAWVDLLNLGSLRGVKNKLFFMFMKISPICKIEVFVTFA